jgi:hypothetical protein
VQLAGSQEAQSAGSASPPVTESNEVPAGGGSSGRYHWGPPVLGPVRRKPLRPAKGARFVASAQVGTSNDGSDPSAVIVPAAALLSMKYDPGGRS